MAVCRLYVDAGLEVGSDVVLQAGQRHYLMRVMRCASSDKLVVFNGRGGEYHGRLMDGGVCHIECFDVV
ncbi:MAG: RNA methyltransferase PUA domain-containing protein [Mariprofundales bacterium]